MNWKNYTDIKPPKGEEVIAYSSKWVNEDFNPRGIRVGFYTDPGDFISAYWWDYQSDYIAISRDMCAANPEFFEAHIDRTEPEYWLKIPKFEI